MEVIKKRLSMQGGICFAIFAVLTGLVMFSSRGHLGFFGNVAMLVSGTVFTTIGVAIGDAIRRFVKPDVLFASSAIDIFRAKVFWMIGPQVIGWIIGFMAFNGFMEHTLGYDMQSGRPRSSQANEPAAHLAVVTPSEAAITPSTAAQGQEAQLPTSGNTSGTGQSQQAQAVEPPGGAGASSLQGDVREDGSSFPKRIDTVGGTLELRAMSGTSPAIFLDGKQLFNGLDAQWQELVRKFQRADGTDVVLLRSSGGRGTSCEALFFFLLIDKSGLRYTPEFGSCSPEASYKQNADVITMTIPRMGGVSSYQLIGDKVTADGALVPMTDSENPSK